MKSAEPDFSKNQNSINRSVMCYWNENAHVDNPPESYHKVISQIETESTILAPKAYREQNKFVN